jgi:hypothetical protein
MAFSYGIVISIEGVIVFLEKQLAPACDRFGHRYSPGGYG